MSRARIPFTLPLSEANRFWKNVIHRNGDECWNWNGCKSKKRELGFYYSPTTQLTYGATRAAFYFFLCDPGSMEVCHRCDNPICCNPNHLFLSTHKGNMEDCIFKGRFVSPTGLLKRILSASERESIYNETQRPGVTYAQVAERYGVSHPMISKVVTAKRRKLGLIGVGTHKLNLPCQVAA